MNFRPLLCLMILFAIVGGTTVVTAESPLESFPTSIHPSVNPKSLSYAPDSVLMGEDETVYLLSGANQSVFRWSVSERGYTNTISLDGFPGYMSYSPDTNRLYLGYADTISQVKLDESLNEQAYITPSDTLRGLSTADEYVFACTKPGTWSVYYTYAPDGTLASEMDWKEYSKEFVWSQSNQRMYHFQDGFSPNDLHWEIIEASGAFGTSQDSPYHSSKGIRHPIRVAPDGSDVVLGSGRVHDAITLNHTYTLPNTIDDAAWIGSNLYTLRDVGEKTQVQKWDAKYDQEMELSLNGTPIRAFSVSEGLLVITHFFDKPWFWILDSDLNIVYEQLSHHVFLPLSLNNYCSDFFDDFSHPASGWPVGENSHVRAEYLNGEYRILSKDSRYLYLFEAPTCDRDDYTVEVDARWEGSPGHSYGIAFDIVGNFDYYYSLEINTDYRQFRLHRRTPSGLYQIVAPTYDAAIHGGTATNHLKITRSGNNTTLSVNGTELGTWWDAGIAGSGGVGLLASTDSDSSSDVRFDNFSVVMLPTDGGNNQSVIETRSDACEPTNSSTHMEPIKELDW